MPLGMMPGTRYEEHEATVKQDIPRLYRRFMLFVARARHHSQRHAGCSQFPDAAAMSPVWQIVTRVGEGQAAIARIKNGIEAGDKHSGWNGSSEQVVHSC